MNINTLIMCPGHGVNIDPSRPQCYSSWRGLYDYPGEASLLLEHNKVAVAMAAAQSNSLLIYSGGATSSEAGDQSEALSYMDVAAHAGWWGCIDVANRAHAEDFALDSLYNMVFSIGEYARRLGKYPERFIVVGWKFKAERYLMHARAITWCREFIYVGINNPPEADGSLAAAISGERQKRQALIRDPFLKAHKWELQRESRNIYCHEEPYSEDVPAMAPFINFLKGKGGYVEPPWNRE